LKTAIGLAWIALGGALGAVARYGVARACGRVLGTAFPYGTFLINISGSFVLGFLMTLLALRTIPNGESVRLGVAVGFLGAYTTFSTYEYESDQLLRDGQWLFAAMNLLGSVAAGLVAIRLGVALARRWA
jgi:CrcB protein